MVVSALHARGRGRARAAAEAERLDAPGGAFLMMRRTRGATIAGYSSIASAVLAFLIPGQFGQGLLGGASVVGALVMFALAWRAARAEERP
jgi:hypothetical protein